ncbi:conserved serine-threonine rich protein [Hirsutella rhossiliensis]|uniref:Conserved serine-threonine rich protein n=1 Tax=Hirsutella rhossiliensis TaxID=111463 RepID=A0A9P8MRW2_9HYPO|nr:conserved serine-threonine rich protein [Hirsutella rhossiliensis]KAH0961108.1 conserved serine-threonine rich protein [Hirsutella rhossiliensis]
MYSLGTEAQSRGFRFGSWYMESLSRNLSWENGSRDSSFPDCMSATSRSWGAPRSSTDGVYADLDDIKSWSDAISGLRPSRNTDRVESEAFDDLFASGGGASKQHSPWTSFHHIRKYLPKRRSPIEATSKSDLHTSKQGQDEGFIDPITNRRVFKPTTTAAALAASNLEHQTLGKNTLASSARDIDAQSGRNSAAISKTEPKPERQRGPANLPSASRDDSIASRERSHRLESRRPNGFSKNKLDGWKGSEDSLQQASHKEPKLYDDLNQAYANLNKFNYGLGSKNSAENDGNHPAQSQSSVELESKNPSDHAKFKSVSGNESTTIPQKPSEELSNGYDDLEKYGPVLWNEPDGLCKPAPEESSKNYPDLDKYGPIYFNEPDGQQHRTADKSKQDKDLDLYKKLEGYKVPFGADDAILAAHERSQQYTDLDKYGPVYWNEPDVFRQLNQGLGKCSHYAATPLAHSRGAHAAASCKAPESHPVEQTKLKYEEPPKKRPDFDASRRAYAVDRNVTSKLYTGLSRDGSRTIINATRTPLSATDRLSDKHRGQSDGVRCDSLGTSRESVGFRTAADIRADVLRRARNDDKKAKLQKAKSEHELTWDATSKDAQDTLKQVKIKTERTLTGNYVRDFPQEFATSWSTANSPSKSSLSPKNGGGSGQPAAASSEMLNMERDEAEPSSMDESFPSEETKLEPSLDRRSTRSSARAATPRLDTQPAEEDMHSREPQGLETNYMEECGDRPAQPAFVKHYKARTPAETKNVPGEASAEGEQPASYRILAYDAATGSLSIAETTSGVADTQTWASPAAVLPRLSSPSKFLPHFARLHEQGYEIVAGGGDVLVFRKVRAASPEATSKPGETCQAWEAPVNPIDLMGKPVTGNFASPTGFVNYDAPAGRDDSKPSPPFRTSGGAATDERRGGEHGRRRGKRGFGRKVVIGAVWVTGIAYAAGVLGEYFATGGVDGLGPTGF